MALPRNIVFPPRQTEQPAARSGGNPTFSPLYRQIKDLLLRALSAGEWAAGALIPSETELAARFGVSQGTVRKAIDEMADENLLVRRQGKGTFVASHDDPRAHYRFLRLRPDDGRVEQKRSLPISCDVRAADAATAAALAIQPGDPTVAVERLLCFDERPIIFEAIFLRAEIFGELTLAMLEQESRAASLYRFFEQRFGVRMIRAEERTRAVRAEAAAAERLNVPISAPLLLVERRTYTYADRPVEWRRGFYATDQHHYYNELA
ncbi:MAG: GntR family transcriptional regulator [Zoogloeaceae bacterium]|jgi:GntR family transcriptional regulator|nr:GntR family transcriptional regulator [Zoogloeaceae bacterium]